MSFDCNKLDKAWVVELHPKGGSQIRQVREVMKENFELYCAGEKPKWVGVCVRYYFDDAKKDLSKIRKLMRDAAKASEELKKSDSEKGSVA